MRVHKSLARARFAPAVEQACDATLPCCAQYFNTKDVVFEEGEPGDKLYVLIEGCVTMYKRSTAQAYRQNVIAQYDSLSDRPWFARRGMPRLPRVRAVPRGKAAWLG